VVVLQPSQGSFRTPAALLTAGAVGKPTALRYTSSPGGGGTSLWLKHIAGIKLDSVFLEQRDDFVLIRPSTMVLFLPDDIRPL